jgi:hypothetical protein
MKLNRFGFSLELINLNNDCVKTIFVSLYLFVRSQTSLDHLVLSSEARRYLTIVKSSDGASVCPTVWKQKQVFCCNCKQP